MVKRLHFCANAFLLLLASCGGDDGSRSQTNSTSAPTAQISNVQPIRVDRPTIKRPGMQAVSRGYNRILTSVTLCSDATEQHCETIDDIIVDTGSVGLKVFDYALSDGGASFPDERDNNASRLAMCARYASGYAWGQMKVVTLKMAGEKADKLPVAIINGSPTESERAVADQNLLPVPDACSTVLGVKQNRKYNDSNGILGLGAPFSDCAECVKSTTYYACSDAGNCDPTFLPTRMQTTQPVASFNTDNNGLVINLPDLDSFGGSPITGQMIFGIGTQSNNQPKFVNVFTLSESGRALLTVNGKVLRVLVDSGTPDYVIPSTLPLGNNKYYTPSSPTIVGAVFSSVDLTGIGLDNQQPLKLSLSDPSLALSENAVAINNLGSSTADENSLALLGLPFFFGRSIYIGLNGRASILGTGPLIAF